MSGGSWDYLYRRVADAALRLYDADDPKRASLAPHVERLADALRAIEWVDSFDSAPGDEHAAIDAFLAGLGVSANGCKVGGDPPVPGIGWGVTRGDSPVVYPLTAVCAVPDGWWAEADVDGERKGADARDVTAVYPPFAPADEPCWRRE